MSDAPTFRIDLAAFHADPYPALARMRAEAPICVVPELGATLLTRRDAVFHEEKRIEIFSSHQPEGLMTRLMGENMMRKDGEAHRRERAAVFPALSPKTVRDHWLPLFRAEAARLLDALAPRGGADLVRDYALPLSGAALVAITGLSGFSPQTMDRVSQAMIDGCANYAGRPEVEARCHAATAEIDAEIDARLARAAPVSVLGVQRDAGLPMESLRANVKLVISGGQNEPRDAIAGAIWALLTHPGALAEVQAGRAGWAQAFEEYARWISPIGMSPRRVARDATVRGVRFAEGDRVFLMFGSANRDEAVFEAPERFDNRRDTGPSIPFGAGPHFCAGAAASRALIAEVALPMAFARLPGLRPAGEARFAGWAFRGPLSVPVAWDA
jgi:cytochrome P450